MGDGVRGEGFDVEGLYVGGRKISKFLLCFCSTTRPPPVLLKPSNKTTQAVTHLSSTPERISKPSKRVSRYSMKKKTPTRNDI